MPLSGEKSTNGVIKKVLWYLSASRNALLVVMTSFAAYLVSMHYNRVPSGLPSFKIPDFNVHDGNKTVSFIDVCSELGSGLILLPMVAVLANVAIAKSFCKFKQTCQSFSNHF